MFNNDYPVMYRVAPHLAVRWVWLMVLPEQEDVIGCFHNNNVCWF